MRIGIVACCKSKLARPAPARDLYTSHLFRGSLRHAEAACDVVFVASALHGLVVLDEVIEPYERSLADIGKRFRVGWGQRVVDDIAARCPGEQTLVLYAGAMYADPIRAEAFRRGWTIEEPLAGMQIGQRLRHLSQAVAA